MTEGDTRKLLNRTGACVAAALFIILAGAMYALTTHEIPEKNHDLLVVLVTAVAQLVSLVVGYFFGSSAGNKAKDDAIATQSETIKAAQAALPPLAGATPAVTLPAGDSVTIKADEPKPESP